MNIYAIYTNPNREDTPLIPIKAGFSFIAAILNFFWALYHRMWRVVFILLIINILVFIFQTNNIATSIIPVIHIATMAIFGFFTTELREYDIQRKGYQLQDIIYAPSELEAELKFLTRQNLILDKS